MRSATLMTLLLAALTVGGCRGNGDNQHAGRRLSDGELGGLVLRLRDLGGGYQEFADGRTLRVELDPALGGQATRFDRQDGWTARYRSLGKGSRSRLLTLVSTVDVFAQASGASRFFEAATSEEARAATGQKPIDVPHIGDESRGMASIPTAHGAVGYLKIVWRNGRAVSSVSASGFAGALEVNDLAGLASRQSNYSRTLN